MAERRVHCLARSPALGLNQIETALQPLLDLAERSIVQRREIPAIRRREQDDAAALADRVHKGMTLVNGRVVDQDDRTRAREYANVLNL